METSIHISEPKVENSPLATKMGNIYPDSQIDITLTVHEFSKVKTINIDLIQKAFSKILQMQDYEVKKFISGVNKRC